jgi:UDPglucose--hexose-1-phosphate uridylyltransferase
VAVKASAAGAPLNFWLHTAPADARGPFHWHLEIAPRTSTLAGFELGSDIAVVIKDPDVAAAEYRAALPPA